LLYRSAGQLLLKENPAVATLPDIRFRSKLYYYAGLVTSVYDGDTLKVDIDVGLGIWRRSQIIRLWKVNTPEVRGADRERGLAVRDFVAGLILDRAILVRTILDKRGSDRTEKFGRLLGEVLLSGEAGEVINLNDLLIQRGMALPLDEGGSLVQEAGRSVDERPAVPETVHCLYCGEVRAVDEAMDWVAQCPNCLDGPYPWRTRP
jgi:micrococcal nuclease